MVRHRAGPRLILALLILSCVPTGESLLLGLEEYFLDPALKLVSLKLTDPSVSGHSRHCFLRFLGASAPDGIHASPGGRAGGGGNGDRRLIVYIATPLGREKVIRTEAFSLVFGQFAMLAVSMGAGVLFAELLRPGELEIMEFLFLGLGAFAIQFVLGAFGFLISCSGMGKKLRALFLWGLTGLSFVLYLLGNLGGILELPGNLTVFSVLRPERFGAGNGALAAAFLLLLGLVFYGFAFLIFRKKDLQFGRKGIS